MVGPGGSTTSLKPQDRVIDIAAVLDAHVGAHLNVSQGRAQSQTAGVPRLDDSTQRRGAQRRSRVCHDRAGEVRAVAAAGERRIHSHSDIAHTRLFCQARNPGLGADAAEAQ